MASQAPKDVIVVETRPREDSVGFKSRKRSLNKLSEEQLHEDCGRYLNFKRLASWQGWSCAPPELKQTARFSDEPLRTFPSVITCQ